MRPKSYAKFKILDRIDGHQFVLITFRLQKTIENINHSSYEQTNNSVQYCNLQFRT